MKSYLRILWRFILVLFLMFIFYIGGSIAISYIWKISNVQLWVNEWSLFENIASRNLAYRFTPSSMSGAAIGNVLLVHGFAAWWMTWKDQEILFSQHWYDVYSLDLPPFGMSDVYPDEFYSREWQAQLINQFISQKKLKNIILVAHSYGWKAALESYMKEPWNFSSMILLDVALWFPRDPNQVFSIPSWLPWFILTHNFLRDMIMRYLVTNSFIGTKALQTFLYDPASLTKDRLSIYKLPFQISGKWENVWDWLAYISTHPESWLSTDKIQYNNIHIPTLLIWWREDTITPLAQWKELHRMIPWSEMVEIENVNHIPQIENPTRVNQIISGFLAKLRH